MNSTEPQLIALMGAECSGKTTLAQALARHFEGLWVPEYLRTFCQQQGRLPVAAEQLMIMQTQWAHQSELLTQAREQGCGYLFCDTTALQTAIYSDYYFADRSLYARARWWHRRYALTLLLVPDIGWQPDDGQRDGDRAQSAIHAMIEHELASLPTLRRVTGAGEDRLRGAIHALASRQPTHARRPSSPGQTAG